MKKKQSKQEQLQHERDYVDFLEKRLSSTNFKKNVSEEEFQKTQEKYKNVKFKLRLLEK